MQRMRALLAAAGVVVGVVVAVGVDPAGATVTLSSSGGNTVTVTVAGDEGVSFSCVGGQVRVNGVSPAPAVGCGALIKVIITGDAGVQDVDARGLDVSATFPLHPFIQVSLGAGNDLLTDTVYADTIDMGPNDDQIEVSGAANTTLNMGTGMADGVRIVGTIGVDTITATSTNSSASVQVTNAGGTQTHTATNAESLGLYGQSGNDTVNASGVTAASSIDSLRVDGGPDVNTLTSTSIGTSFFSVDGRATMTGSPLADVFWSTNEADIIHTGGGADLVHDYRSLRSGGRTVTGPGGATYHTDLFGGDVVARIRPGSGAGTAVEVNSLTRPGVTQLTPAVTTINPLFIGGVSAPDLALLDVVSPGAQFISSVGDSTDDDVADITIPSGSWNSSGSPSTVMLVDPANPAYGSVSLSNFGPVKVHAPWSNKNEGFAHRATRDLVFRFLTDAQRMALGNHLQAGTTTRMQVANDLVFSDEYRGLDVDRVFRLFLEREPDAGGRTYWINRIREGRSLRKFRAQLFGSNEYYTKAGGTPENFVGKSYADVLGRRPDSAGFDYWVNRIKTGTDRGSVANFFLASSEARRFLVRDQFLRFVLRYPTQTELDTWMPVILDEPQGEQSLITFLVASGTYYNQS